MTRVHLNTISHNTRTVESYPFLFLHTFIHQILDNVTASSTLSAFPYNFNTQKNAIKILI